ncbi:helix-turn-helix domain-containing protein [Akkermansiaceae bacterium]|nr:helix-turn-helix domain-containing protein [Akkermansiaceae bacterium]
MKEEEKLLTIRDVAQWLRVRPERIDLFIRENGFPAIYLPSKKYRVLRFNRRSVEAWLKSREEWLPE